MQPRRSTHCVVTVLAVAVSVVTLDRPVLAQRQTTTSTPLDSTQPVPGWTFTPTLIYSGTADDNVLMHGRGDATTGDYVNVVNPRGQLDYNGRYSQFDLFYTGAFLMYRSLNTLNSYDQHGSISLRRRVSKHIALFAADSLSIVPTTDAIEFVGIPFLRTGSRINSLRTGVEATLSKRTMVTLAYTAQWIDFDSASVFGQLIRGGHGQGGTLTLRHRVSEHTTLLGDYDYQRATVNGIDTFDVQNSSVGVEQRLTERTVAYAAVGVARLGISSFGPARTGPAWRAGIARQFEKAGFDLSYSRSFVPAYGIGGTTQNEEASGRVRLPLARRVYAQSAISWRRNEPLTRGELRLKSWWIDAGLGVGLQPWLRLEGYYNGMIQEIDRPGGQMDHNRVGFQIVMTKPMRIQ